VSCTSCTLLNQFLTKSKVLTDSSVHYFQEDSVDGEHCLRSDIDDNSMSEDDYSSSVSVTKSEDNPLFSDYDDRSPESEEEVQQPLQV
jgi:hypothetical protein